MTETRQQVLERFVEDRYIKAERRAEEAAAVFTENLEALREGVAEVRNLRAPRDFIRHEAD